jgi:hypothetical protein
MKAPMDRKVMVGQVLEDMDSMEVLRPVAVSLPRLVDAPLLILMMISWPASFGKQLKLKLILSLKKNSGRNIENTNRGVKS